MLIKLGQMGDFMKKIFSFCIILIVILNLTSCNMENNSDLNMNDKSNSDISDIETTSGYFQYWDEIDFPIIEVCIPDHTTAIKVTESIVDGLKKDGKFTDYCAQSVFFDIESQVWIVSFFPDGQEEGASLSIAIRKDDSQVVKMWVGE